MLRKERHPYIVERLRREGRVLVAELATELQVSDDTIRRDLSELAAAGVLYRVHGGALPASPAVVHYTARAQQAPEAKLAIAQAAAGLIHDGQTVLLDGGTTTRLLAQHLPPMLRATVITHSPPVAEVLAEHPTVEVVLLGGRLQKAARVAVGAATIDALRMLRADVYVAGTCALHPELGLSTTDLEEAYVKRAMIEHAADVIALVSSEKLGTASRYTVGAVADLTHLVTDGVADDALLQPYRSAGVTIVRG
jgi:DeoR/GlpR family transcriptional regulator of sugar metabolism